MDLDERVMQFQCLEMPGQPMMMHMGTSYLVNDLHAEVKRLRAELEKRVRPIRSEEDNAVEEMLDVVHGDGHLSETGARALYRAGYRR